MAPWRLVYFVVLPVLLKVAFKSDFSNTRLARDEWRCASPPEGPGVIGKVSRLELRNISPSSSVIAVGAYLGVHRQRCQSPAVERAKPLSLACPESRRLDSMKTPTLFAGMGSANKYPWADPQPANANS